MNIYYKFKIITFSMDIDQVQYNLRISDGVGTMTRFHFTKGHDLIATGDWMKPFPERWQDIESFVMSIMDGTYNQED